MKCLVLGLCLVGAAVAADEGHFVTAGDHRLYTYCSGDSSKATVVLVNGLGAGLEGWSRVQAEVAKFAKVCSYDRAGEGRSASVGHLQTPEEVVRDLKQLLDSEKLPGPYVLVGWSLGGIYVRSFAKRYPELTAGIVLVDSSHEEQYSHLAAISPSLSKRYATQDGRFDGEEFLRSAGQLKPGEHLEWHLDVPLIVLEHKRFTGPARTEPERYDVQLHEMQQDLAARSKFGKLIETNSGHAIAAEQPSIVVDSIRAVIQGR